MNLTDERIVIVDENNLIVGEEWRSVMRKKHLIHRATFILVFNSANELFVQKRSRLKDIYPGNYDLTSGGVVLWNELPEPSAKREIEEELGIKETALEFLFEFFYESKENKVWGSVFKCVYDGAIRLQEEEIEEGGFLPINDVMDLIHENHVTPESIYVFEKFRNDYPKS
ncbi:MAG: NUDIX domain-containing protein [Proteobacteria bacterium]|nr:NUDIX domain-containing protein [Pseudomonadota bacterium]